MQGGPVPHSAEWDSDPAGCATLGLPPPPPPLPPPPPPPPTVAPDLACVRDPEWEYAFELIDNPTVNDLPDEPSAIAAGFSNLNAYYIGNEALDALALSAVQICWGTGDHRMPLSNSGATAPWRHGAHEQGA